LEIKRKKTTVLLSGLQLGSWTSASEELPLVRTGQIPPPLLWS